MEKSQIKIALVPIGSISPELMQWCRQTLPEHLDASVIITDSLSLPDSAYNPRRKQYLGDDILKSLYLMDVDVDKIVGLIDRDCYVPNLNFIFGLATGNGRHAFVALPRLRQSFYSQKEDNHLFHLRVLKEIIHELGHTWNLQHCPNPKCIMHFSNTLNDTDIKGPGFCEICRKKLS